jgi:hypothetical protein
MLMVCITELYLPTIEQLTNNIKIAHFNGIAITQQFFLMLINNLLFLV